MTTTSEAAVTTVSEPPASREAASPEAASPGSDALTGPSPVLGRYRALRRFPGGGRAFDLALAAFAPFNAFLGVRVSSLEPGHALTAMGDRAFRRNHLSTVHAVALSGLAEVTGNLAVATLLPAGASFVVRRFAIVYEKPARGVIHAECRVPESYRIADRAEVELETTLRDSAGVVVARASACVRVVARRR